MLLCVLTNLVPSSLLAASTGVTAEVQTCLRTRWICSRKHRCTSTHIPSAASNPIQSHCQNISSGRVGDRIDVPLVYNIADSDHRGVLADGCTPNRWSSHNSRTCRGYHGGLSMLCYSENEASRFTGLVK